MKGPPLTILASFSQVSSRCHAHIRTACLSGRQDNPGVEFRRILAPPRHSYCSDMSLTRIIVAKVDHYRSPGIHQGPVSKWSLRQDLLLKLRHVNDTSSRCLSLSSKSCLKLHLETGPWCIPGIQTLRFTGRHN